MFSTVSSETYPNQVVRLGHCPPQHVMPPKQASEDPNADQFAATPIRTATTVKSEEECYDLLAKEMASIPDRETPAPQHEETNIEGPQASPSDGEHRTLATMLLKHRSSDMAASGLSRAPAASTSTNLIIAKTIRAAMAGIRPRS
ncbi:hypothetical protein QQS21_002280 [Conoideocrella luteorostrata]|uniref:Uncharacterized protein n=1 Tax=Conoideocrella luteorostrata TaxID=1105319 RepID=A0AAJ0FXG7_9HYPO|nr:hypothetical protein QQS21_002280 [Conoideocrella luteorostrata]